MRSKLPGIVVILLASAVPASATEPAAKVCDTKQLDAAYEAFCDEIAGEEECKARGEDGYQWLKLAGYCAGIRTTQPSCQSFDEIKKDCMPLVLAYDHPTGIWNVRGRLEEKRVVKDVTGKPTASLGRGEELWVIVERTNPLLFGLTEGTPSEADVPELAQLKKLAGLLGGSIQAVLKSQATAEEEIAAAQGADVLREYRETVKKRLEELANGVADLRCEVDQTTLQISRLTAFAQAIELDDKTAKYIWSPLTCRPGGPQFSRSELDEILEQLALLAGRGSCLPALKAARKVFTGDATKKQDLLDAIAEYRAEIINPACSELGTVAQSTLEGNFEALESIIDQAEEVKKFLENDNAKEMRRALPAAIELAEREEALLKDATTLLTQRDSARKALAQVELLEKRLHMARLTKKDTELAIADIDRRLILDAPVRVLHIDKIQSRSIKLAVQGAFAATVVPARPVAVDAGFALDSLTRSLWGIGASVIWTSLRNPTFSAVNDTSTPPKLIIAKTDEETRAGKLALLLNYNLGRRLAPTGGALAQAWGIEFGAAADTSTPGFFGGLSLRLGKYVRLGGGWTYQQIKDLRGQKLGQEVKAAGDVKTRDRFELDNYISLSIAIESINLFSVN